MQRKIFSDEQEASLQKVRQGKSEIQCYHEEVLLVYPFKWHLEADENNRTITTNNNNNGFLW